MHPYTIGEECTSRHFYYYIEEIFNRDKNVNYVEQRKIKREPTNKCSVPKIINKTDNWTQNDQNTLYRAKETCIKKYKSCLKIFWKKTNYSYAALCR